MRRFRRSLLIPSLWALALLALGCAQMRMPRLTYEPETVARLPITVKLEFDQRLREATVEQPVCGNATWVGQLGEAIELAFVGTGQKRFASVIVEPQAGAPSAAAEKTPDLTVRVRLINKAFEATTRTGSADNFMARMDVLLAAEYQDRLGRTLGDAPLEYADTFNVYTPMLGSGGTQCATGGLDNAVQTAAERLADQMVAVVQRLTAQPPTSSASTYAPPGLQPAPGVGAGALSLRAELLDENDNQILEGGEKIGVRLDVINTGAAPIGSVSVVLSGTPALVEAFATILAAPIQIGPLKPGEHKSTVFWGRMAERVEAQRGELRISVVASESTGGRGATSSADQTVIAAIRPGSAGGAEGIAAPRAGQSSDRSAGGGAAPAINRYAVIVGLDRYRDPSWSPRSDATTHIDRLPVVLSRTAGLPRNHILFLKNELAARADLEEALTTWLPNRVDPDSVVLFYFAGQAVATPTSGDVFLIPYDGTPTSSPRRLLSLRTLQGKLTSLGAKLCLLLIEAPVAWQQAGTPPKGPSARTAKAPNWQGALGSSDGPPAPKRPGPLPLIQIVGRSQDQQPAEGLLASLMDPADTNHDGRITVGEFLHQVRNHATVYPALSPTAPELAIPLADVNSQ